MDEINKKAMSEIQAYRQLDQLLGQWANEMMQPLAQEFTLADSIYVISDKDLGYDWWRQLVDHARLNSVTLPPSFFQPIQRIGSN
ncbi:hypothetical protein [Paenibacillus terrigena]|uniref:hypothetical protein n=1 Tax=Paenibacillus terrigena TaxID=369333 RepID=UPI000368B9E1|nr:hypothetical protein [Paenibacillus terrigena]